MTFIEQHPDGTRSRRGSSSHSDAFPLAYVAFSGPACVLDSMKHAGDSGEEWDWILLDQANKRAVLCVADAVDEPLYKALGAIMQQIWAFGGWSFQLRLGRSVPDEWPTLRTVSKLKATEAKKLWETVKDWPFYGTDRLEVPKLVCVPAFDRPQEALFWTAAGLAGGLDTSSNANDWAVWLDPEPVPVPWAALGDQPEEVMAAIMRKSGESAREVRYGLEDTIEAELRKRDFLRYDVYELLRGLSEKDRDDVIAAVRKTFERAGMA